MVTGAPGTILVAGLWFVLVKINDYFQCQAQWPATTPRALLFQFVEGQRLYQSKSKIQEQQKTQVMKLK